MMQVVKAGKTDRLDLPVLRRKVERLEQEGGKNPVIGYTSCDMRIQIEKLNDFRPLRPKEKGNTNGKTNCRDVLFLGQKSIPATEVICRWEEIHGGHTLAANREACVGMAANMIGVKNASSS